MSDDKRAVWKEAARQTLESLVELIDGWNDCAADEDRGRNNNALCLVLFDDGSGRLGTSSPYFSDDYQHEFNGQFEFNNVEQLLDRLADEVEV